MGRGHRRGGGGGGGGEGIPSSARQHFNTSGDFSSESTGPSLIYKKRLPLVSEQVLGENCNYFQPQNHSNRCETMAALNRSKFNDQIPVYSVDMDHL